MQGGWPQCLRLAVDLSDTKFLHGHVHIAAAPAVFGALRSGLGTGFLRVVSDTSLQRIGGSAAGELQLLDTSFVSVLIKNLSDLDRRLVSK